MVRFGEARPMVPMLAERCPSRTQICRVNAATEVLPLVPVTAAIVAGWRGKNLDAIEARARRALATRINEIPDGSGAAGGHSATIATAPAAIAASMKRAPSALPPAMATNTLPRFIVRLSAATPLTLVSA